MIATLVRFIKKKKKKETLIILTLNTMSIQICIQVCVGDEKRRVVGGPFGFFLLWVKLEGWSYMWIFSSPGEIRRRVGHLGIFFS